MLAFLFTNPPILVIPFLAALPPLHYNNILPGDKPFCFKDCIAAMLGCLGILWTEITICSNLFSLESFIRMAGDIAHALFIVFSFVPGFCDSFGFGVNIWMLPTGVSGSNT